MATGPVIETPRVRVVPFAERHLTGRYVGWLTDPEVVRFSQQRFRTHTPATCRAYFESFADSPDLFYALEAGDPAVGHFGNITVAVDSRDRVADVALLVGDRRLWGKGYGTEAFGAVCRHLLTSGTARKVTAGTLAVNEGMLAVMRKVGMADDGRRVGHHLFEGRAVDVVYGALFAGAGG